jgi:hypothetical protein
MNLDPLSMVSALILGFGYAFGAAVLIWARSGSRRP